jgi:hypothetical protein
MRVVTTLAGHTREEGKGDGPAASARFSLPHDCASTSDGRVFVVDKHVVRVVKDNNVTTLAALPADTRRVSDVASVCWEYYSDTILVGTWNHLARISADGSCTGVAGQLNPIAWGYRDGPASEALFGLIKAIAVDSSRRILIADMFNHRIRYIEPATKSEEEILKSCADFALFPPGLLSLIVSYLPLEVKTLAGSTYGSADGMGTAAQFKYPVDLTVGLNRGVYVADSFDNGIRHITCDGLVTTVAVKLFCTSVAYNFASNRLYASDYRTKKIIGIAVNALRIHSKWNSLAEFEKTCERIRVSPDGTRLLFLESYAIKELLL